MVNRNYISLIVLRTTRRKYTYVATRTPPLSLYGARPNAQFQYEKAVSMFPITSVTLDTAKSENNPGSHSFLFLFPLLYL